MRGVVAYVRFSDRVDRRTRVEQSAATSRTAIKPPASAIIDAKIFVKRLECIEIAHDTSVEMLKLVGMPRLCGHAESYE